MSIPHYPFYFIRHGETDWNRANRIMGQKDIPLNEKGIQQSHQSRAFLKNFKFGRIWSSPLQRAYQTAEIINKAFDLPIDYKNFLKERGWGAGEGESHERFFPDMKSNFSGKEEGEKIPGGAEPYSAFKARIIVVFREILVPSLEPPLIVSHGGVFRVLTTLLAEVTLPASNCSLYFFRPPQHPSHPWFIAHLTEGGDNLKPTLR